METIPEYCHYTLTVRNFLELLYALKYSRPSHTSSTALTALRSATEYLFQKNASLGSADCHCHQSQQPHFEDYAFGAIISFRGEHLSKLQLAALRSPFPDQTSC